MRVEPISSVVVAVPAKNEAELVGACLHSIERAVAAAQTSRGVTVRTVVTLDGCTDETALVATAAGVATVVTDHVGVGLARDAAIGTGLRALGSPARRLTWIACTDADTVVPPDWLCAQLRHADDGVDALLGTVQPATAPTQRSGAWHEHHRLVEGHDHIHGANLGLRASAWAEAGGFGPLRVHEDVDLVSRVRRGPFRVAATDTTRVTTSARPRSRVTGGFADYLRVLGEARP